MKQGSKYELLTQQVYQVLLNAEWPGKNICVKHDVKLIGSSGQEHQIDVYWEYQLADVTHKVAIECKEYSKPLAIGKVRDFYGVLADLKDVKGIMVALNGYQKGARDFAQSYGINLKELSVSNEVPIIAEIENRLHVSVRSRLFLIDKDWAASQGWSVDKYRQRISCLSMDGSRWQNSPHLPLQTTDSLIVDADGNKIVSIEDLEAQIDKEIVGGTAHAFTFDKAFVNTSGGPIKIKEILFSDREENHTSVFKIEAEGFVQAILKDAIDGNIQNILCPASLVSGKNS